MNKKRAKLLLFAIVITILLFNIFVPIKLFASLSNDDPASGTKTINSLPIILLKK